MADYLNLPIGEQVPEVLNAIIEIPLGETNKYEYDKKLHVFRLDRNLFSPVHYPGDYGFFPQTLSTDGDPLDVKSDVKRVFIAGQEVPMTSRQTVLRDRYSGK